MVMDELVGPEPRDTANLLPRTARYLDYFQALAEVGKALTKTLRLDDVVTAVGHSVSQLLEPRDWSLLLVDEPKQELFFAVTVGNASDAIKNMRLKIGEGIAGWVAQHREPVLAPRVADDPRFSRRMNEASSFRTASILCVPLICRDRVVGVIELVRNEGDGEPYGSEQLELLTPLADFAAIAIDNARTFARVQELTISDEWTGLYNARFLMRFLDEETRRARRYRHSLSVIFFDLDHFKLVNDRNGHAVGSGLLRYVGEVVRACVRDTDRAIRYGGDEFVVVMPETPKCGAMVMAERLRERVAEGIFRTQATVVSTTASFGVATFPDDGNEPMDVLAAADRAMYRAKAKGRNNVVNAADRGAEAAPDASSAPAGL
jgi:diguanylate cyclase (GGDEF)-like protein